jgi:site-specific recombinase XerD
MDVVPAPAIAIATSPHADQRLIGLWLHGRPPHTQRAYRADVAYFARQVGTPLDRVSEACGLTWRDVQERGDAGQVTVYGKGGKTRAVLLSAATWAELVRLRGNAPNDDPVFPSKRTGRHLNESAVWRVVRAAAQRAGIAAGVSPHWLRHAHASHALDRGAPIHLVQATLGHSSVATTGRYLHARPTDSTARYLPV